MTLRTVSTPFAPKLLTEWRTWLGTVTGVDYTNLDSAIQTEFQDLVDEAHEWVDKTYGHQAWTMREWSVGGSTISAPSTTDGTFLLPADCRHPIMFQESETGVGTTGIITTKAAWMQAGAGFTAHPWDNQSHPYYFLDGMDDSEPAQAQWRRVPTPSSSASAFTALGRGYMDIMGTSGNASYQGIPAAIKPELKHHLKMTWFASRGEYDKVTPEAALRDDAVRATQINDAPGGSETLIRPEAPQEFFDEMAGP